MAARAGEAVGAEQRAGIVLGAVDAVGVAGDGMECPDGRRAPPPAPAGIRRCARRGPCRAPSPSSRRRRSARRARSPAGRAARSAARSPAWTRATSRASPSMAVAEDDGAIAGGARDLGGGLERILAARDDHGLRCAPGADRRASASRRSDGQLRGDGGRRGDADISAGPPRIGAGRRVGHGRAGGDHRRIVARHVGDQQGDDPRRRGSGGEPAALDGREMLAHAVHLARSWRRISAAPG